MLPSSAALVLNTPPEPLSARQVVQFREAQRAARRARELTRLARVERRSRPTIFARARESFRLALGPRRFDDEDDFEALFH